MTKRIKAAPRKTKPASRTPTAGKTKARKATARGRHPKQPKPEFPDLDTGDESEADDNPQTEQTFEGEEPEPEEEPIPKPQSQPSDRFKRDPWNSHRENERAPCNDPEKATKRAQAPLSALLPKQHYDQWSSGCDSFFAAPLSSVDHFPRPQGLGKCKEKGVRCMMGEKLDFCHHQLKEFLMGGGVYDVAWLKKERVRWHPDKFPGREAVGALAQEMFQMLQMLIDSE